MMIQTMKKADEVIDTNQVNIVVPVALLMIVSGCSYSNNFVTYN